MARFKIGDIILIPMVDGKFGIARVLNKLIGNVKVELPIEIFVF